MIFGWMAFCLVCVCVYVCCSSFNLNGNVSPLYDMYSIVMQVDYVSIRIPDNP